MFREALFRVGSRRASAVAFRALFGKWYLADRVSVARWPVGSGWAFGRAKQEVGNKLYSLRGGRPANLALGGEVSVAFRIVRQLLEGHLPRLVHPLYVGVAREATFRFALFDISGPELCGP